MSHPQQHSDIVEDAPQYRSVMMAGPLSPPPMPRSFASMRPMKASVAPVQIKQSKPTASTSACVWNVADLPSLPAAYFLERSNVYVDGDAQDIANSICETLRMESIAASCDNEDKNLLVAETHDCVKFAVRLFSDQGKVVVEVQRKCGCSYQFREAARSVLRSAKGMTATPAPKRSFPFPPSIPKATPEEMEKQVEEGLDLALKQLNSPMADSQIIGMETLEQLTTCECRRSAAKAVLEEPCKQKVLSAAQCLPSENPEVLYGRHAGVMKRRALAVLANALCALSDAKELEVVLGGNPELKSETLVSALLSALRESTTQPHEATQAARCIKHLMIAREVESHLVELSAIEVIHTACRDGACRFSSLERECQELQQRFNR